MKPLWGIDLGGTKIEGVIIDRDSQDLKVLERLRVPTEKDKGYFHIISKIKSVVDQLSRETGLKPQTLGIGTPGITEPSTGLLKNSNTTHLNGKPFKKDLESALGIPVAAANDANCFAIAETNLGIVSEVKPEAEVVFGIIMGTGVGGGVVVNGKVLNGIHGIGGEWGHNFLSASGGRCYCGQIGCVETVISGTGLQKFYADQTGTVRSLPDIVERHKTGTDPYATETIERLLTYFGKAVAYVVNILDPDAIVLGGGVGNIDLLYTRGAEELKKHIFNTRMDTLLLKPKLGDSAGVFGAALLTDR